MRRFSRCLQINQFPGKPRRNVLKRLVFTFPRCIDGWRLIVPPGSLRRFCRKHLAYTPDKRVWMAMLRRSSRPPLTRYSSLASGRRRRRWPPKSWRAVVRPEWRRRTPIQSGAGSLRYLLRLRRSAATVAKPPAFMNPSQATSQCPMPRLASSRSITQKWTSSSASWDHFGNFVR